VNQLTADTLDLYKQALRSPSDDIAKTISTGTGLIAYDLQAPAKNLYPFVTPLRNVIPRVGGGTGTATNWRQVSSIVGSGFDAMGWVPEGQRSGQMSYATSSKSATYVTIGEEDAATYEAIAAGVHFEDIQARMTFRLLQKMMLKEEMAILGGNAGAAAGGLSLGVPGTPTVSAVANTASTLTTATYYVKVVALTIDGFQNAGGTVLNTVASGSVAAVTAASVCPTTKTVTGADGKTYVLNGGSSNLSAESASQAITSGTNMLAATVTAVVGAVAYAWFVGTASNAETLQAITTINSVTISAPLVAGTQSAATITADSSANPSYAYNGLYTTAMAGGSNAYVSTLATGTAGTGTFLTASGRGSVNEIDTMFQTMWNNFQLSPTVLYVNAHELKNITTKVLSNTAGPLLRYERADSAEAGGEYALTASGTVAYYYNPFNTADGTQTGLRIPIRLHPRVPPGTILGWATNLPIQYQSNEVPNVAEVKTRQGYYQIDWPIVTRQRQVGVYAEAVLAVYAPFAMGVITNIGNG
jgi:hypothetical protein